MKIGHFIAATVLLAPITYFGMTDTAVAANTHGLTLKGEMTLFGERVGSGHNMGESAHLTHDRPTHTFTFSFCSSDGEGRGVLTVAMRLTSSERVTVTPVFKVYEEEKCYNDDLDGTTTGKPVSMPMNSSRNWTMTVSKWEFNDLVHGEVYFNLVHVRSPDYGRPAEPSNVVASPSNLTPLTCRMLKIQCKGKSVSLQWVDNATNETHYEVRNTNLEKIVRLSPNTTHDFWTDLDPTRKQCFQVRAVNQLGPSEWTPVNTAGECV
ncbi:fibronectin type III domain-containing protein [Streptomyces sp. XY413]|uniref:fibronectin type III domain-containing protein n=1 Tax=Streptomyces sp. XY413 TaxID=1519479 RepID=UPI000A76DF7E|nr:fibronectin type III domain-containing protein [Streptomyces sp. XY413]